MKMSGALAHKIGLGHVLSIKSKPEFVQTESPVAAPASIEPVEAENTLLINSDTEENDDPMFEF